MRVITANHKGQPAGYKWGRSPEGYDIFQLMNPVVTCPPPGSLQRLGGNKDWVLQEAGGGAAEVLDGQKWLCTGGLQAPCTVYSLGSHEDTSFEAAILARTPCHVVTFDCGYDVKPLGARHRYLRKCIGDAARAAQDPAFLTLEQAARQLGHTRVDLMKVDIEGFEFDVLGALGERDALLPGQLAVELHYYNVYVGTPSAENAADFSNLLWPYHMVSLQELSLFVGHLANLGYAIVHREDNPGCDHCTELTLVRVEQGAPSLQSMQQP
eukprot:CAMPEP_0202873366 /NCGR_PEP_ID=MMETSP1391-20130828/23140_1 /ASSEMBLY_ACC=CAM_ASM_000867 /TAXON_ID=1034604 /ORGANISM="Chlamydomonas leiostraca, Strain SAG 11-49" /LENGTH=267 /DNA_ID=CAMNT_0049554577 /DNA_START=133 /DNA_END=936 /DNA_ORIENTATION=-